MTLQERIQQDLKSAMMARDTDRLATLRLLKSALGYLEIERKTERLTDADVVGVVQKEIKKRRDSIEQFTAGGRAELAEKEGRELAVLRTFLPQPLSESELEQLVRSVIRELGATSKKEMGTVIKAAQAKAAGRAEGKAISALVGRLLP